jgi:hypothetical protein
MSQEMGRKPWIEVLNKRVEAGPHRLRAWIARNYLDVRQAHEQAGATWQQITDAMTETGITQPGGRPYNREAVRQAFNREHARQTHSSLQKPLGTGIEKGSETALKERKEPGHGSTASRYRPPQGAADRERLIGKKDPE